MATVTETRRLFESDLDIFAHDPTFPAGHQDGVATLYGNTTPWPKLPPPLQTTTSWRTGRRDTGLAAQYDSVVNEAGVFSALKSYDLESGQSGTDRGHDFSTYKEEFETSHPSVHLTRSGRVYDGPLVVDPSSTDWGGYVQPWTSVDLDVYGTQAIARVQPTHPATGLAVAIAELKREGLPHLSTSSRLRKRGLTARNAGKDYLNLEFGWKPLISDVRSAVSTIARAGRILDQFKRDAGRIVRRRYVFPVQVVSEQSVNSAAIMKIGPNQSFSDFVLGNGGRGPTVETRTLKREIWFSGAFQYYLPRGDSAWDRIVQRGREAQKLFGLDITPDVLWNLQPWSWLVDWHLDTGSFIANVSAVSSDGLVVRWGYLMCRETVEHTVTIRCNARPTGDSVGTVTNVWRTITKRRVHATPYGFGLNPSSFTERQKAILAAIAVTR